MNYSMHLLLALLPVGAPRDVSDPDVDARRPPDRPLPDILAPAMQAVLDLVDAFRSRPVSPADTRQFEADLQGAVRELGRLAAQWTYNHLEPAAVADLPAHLRYEAGDYTRLGRKTPQHAWTLFGPIRLWRAGYRPTAKDGDPTLFPLTLGLGLIDGASPALAERAAHLLAEAGMTQQRVLARLRQDCGVGWGVKKLRQVTAAVAAALAGQRHEVQVDRLLTLLGEASAGTGPHKPVLSVGRDGVTLGRRCKGGSVFEVAATATVSVLDRRGRRLGTVYLASTPEFGQGTMTAQLTRLLQGVLARWDGPLPRLAYVTDAGDNETAYYHKVLRRLKHPRTREQLVWIRVVDYYHASERLWAMAERLFGKGRRAAAWVRKMQKWLLKPGGVNRVLHSAAALRESYGLGGAKRKEFQKAYRYLRDRMGFMQYEAYRRLGIPLGSGVTEAACKTVFGQRLKLSGMRWHKAGAQTVLDLRVVLLSRVWDDAYARALAEVQEAKVGGQRPSREKQAKNVA
jgi:hypothetical protein